VAIKVMSVMELGGNTMVERFRQEARVAASLSHPNIVPIYSVRSTDRLHYFIMKYVDGSLDAVLKRTGALPIPLVRTIITQVGSALAYAHKRGVIHRDVKPANILLDEEGLALVSDFGIAKVADSTVLTTAGTVVGTPMYMSPEQYSGAPLTSQSDQYSLGVVAFELLTGKVPFTGASVAEVMRGHLMEAAPDVREFRRDCPTDLATCVKRMLSKAADDRFESMEAVVAYFQSMTALDSAEARRQLRDLAITASGERPHISQPLSPVPASELRKSPAGPGRPRARSRTRRGWIVAGTAVALIAPAVVWFARFDQRVPPNRSTPNAAAAPGQVTSPVSQSAPAAGTKEVADIHPSKSDHGSASTVPTRQRADSTTTRHANPRQAVAPPVRVETVEVIRRDTVAAPAARAADSASRVAAAPPTHDTVIPPKPMPTFGVVRLGSKRPGAGLYVDGKFVGLLTGGVQALHFPGGMIKLSIRADDCASWDTLLVLVPGDTSTIGFRNPKCTK
jgi:serine/threonine protein kinase